MTRRQRLKRIAVTLFAMLALASLVLLGAVDPEGREIARYRNSLIAEAGRDGDFDWTPTSIPVDYLRQRAAVPDELARWHDLPSTGNTLSRALAIARSLSVKPRIGGQIQRSVVATLATIEATGAGYCVDYVAVFAGLAYANGIEGRVWAFSFDGFGGHGHVFNEIWDTEGQTWVMIDVFHGFYPGDDETGKPLSALEFRRRLSLRPDSIRWQRLTPSFFAFKNDSEALDYYRRGAPEWYLWWGNNYLDYDRHLLVSQAGRLGRLPERVVAILTGTIPKLKVLLTEENRDAFQRLMWLRYRLLAVAGIEIFLMIFLLWHLLRLRANRNGGCALSVVPPTPEQGSSVKS